MKKTIAMLVLLALVAALFIGCETEPRKDTTGMKVALITDYADIDDKAYNQAAYEAARAWCEENEVDFTYDRPTGDSTVARVAAIDKAVADGYNVLLLPGYAFAGAIVETVEANADVKFVALDVSEYDLQDARGTADDFSWEYPANLYACVYREELAGYLVGYAAVKLGYRRLGYVGNMAVPAVVRYGYGFLQGVNDAAVELGIQDEIELKHVYHNCFCTEHIEPWIASWFEGGTEVVFACGGGIYIEAGRAAEKCGGRLIGSDVDMAPVIDGNYGAGMTVTSAVKGLAATVRTQLDRIACGSFEGGTVENLGIVSENPEENYVQLPASTQWAEGRFTESDYQALVSDLLNGKHTVSDQSETPPALEIHVDYQGNIVDLSSKAD